MISDNIKTPYYCPFVGENIDLCEGTTDDRWIPLTKGQKCGMPWRHRLILHLLCGRHVDYTGDDHDLTISGGWGGSFV